MKTLMTLFSKSRSLMKTLMTLFSKSRSLMNTLMKTLALCRSGMLVSVLKLDYGIRLNALADEHLV